MKYNIEISVMDHISYTISTASCEDHAKELAVQMFKQDYPDLEFLIISCEE